MKKIIIILFGMGFLFSCTPKGNNTMVNQDLIRLMVLDPGHFHAALVQKEMYPGVDSTVFVYAPDGMEVNDYIQKIESYNNREASPTSWTLKVYKGEDFFEKMLEDSPGNLVVLAGNNKKKTEYILSCINAGLNVYADKPMAIDSADFQELKEAFNHSNDKGLLLYDIMTERFEITTLLQKILSEQENVFGKLLKGSVEEPAITKESVHHFSKNVSGKALIRPAWFFDVKQEGEAIADVGTHLVDLIFWEAFPEGILNYEEEIEILSSKKWTTNLSAAQFEKVTGLSSFPEYLNDYVFEDTLQVVANSSVSLKVKDVHAKASVQWSFQAPDGAGDTHYSIMRGSISDLIIQQGPEENYRPELYIQMHETEHADLLQENIHLFIHEKLSKQFPGVSFEMLDKGFWRINIPNKYRTGHERHFAEVTRQFLKYMDQGKIPDWEINQMLAKYFTTTKAVQLSE